MKIQENQKKEELEGARHFLNYADDDNKLRTWIP
jgi:hypothetical protein